jgi:lipoate-protein ligase B
MSVPPARTNRTSIETHLLGQIDFDRALALQNHLLDQVAERDDGQICLLFCEHPAIITIGRDGSPADVHYELELLRRGQIEVRWVKRGGGALIHSPGQLAVYPIVPLGPRGMTPGEYLARLQSGIAAALADLRFPTESRPGQTGLWGRTGKVATLGVAVRRWVTYHGAYVNVCPSPGLFRLVESDVDESAGASTLVAEHRGRAQMPKVRAALVRRLSESLGCDHYHMHTGHPWLRQR